MKLLALFLVLPFVSAFDVGFISRLFPNSFTETEPFSVLAAEGPKTLGSAHFFLDSLVANGSYSMAHEGCFLVRDPEAPVFINNRRYYWSTFFHPSLKNGSSGCKIPMTWLMDASENMPPFHYRMPPFKNKPEISIRNFLLMLRFVDTSAPTEMAWSCRTPNEHCCGVGCCPTSSKPVYPSNTVHQIFVYVCVGFLILCVLALFGALFSFVFNDFWHRYFSWFPSSPRPPVENYEMSQLTPVSHRSPSRRHLAV